MFNVLQLQEKGTNRTFLDAIPRSLTYKQEPIAIGNLRFEKSKQPTLKIRHLIVRIEHPEPHKMME